MQDNIHFLPISIGRPITWEEFLQKQEELVNQAVSKTLNSESLYTKILEALEKPLTVEEVAKEFQVSKQTIYTWLKEDKLKSHIIGGRRYFYRSELKQQITQS